MKPSSQNTATEKPEESCEDAACAVGVIRQTKHTQAWPRAPKAEQQANALLLLPACRGECPKALRQPRMAPPSPPLPSLLSGTQASGPDAALQSRELRARP